MLNTDVDSFLIRLCWLQGRHASTQRGITACYVLSTLLSIVKAFI